MGSAELIANEYKLMEKDFTVYVFDRRSDLPPVYSVREMARDTAEAIMQLSLKDIYLYGASQGGMIAQCIAIDHPEVVEKLILAVTAPSANAVAANKATSVKATNKRFIISKTS